MFTVTVEIDGLERKFETMAEEAKDLDPAFRKFGSYLRKKALARYAAQDFAPLADSTLQQRAQSGLRSLGRTLARDTRRALARKKVENTGATLAKILSDPGAVKVTGLTRGAQNRLAVLAEFHRRHQRGSTLAERADLKPLTLKQGISLGGRTDRAVARAVGKQILGGLPRTLALDVGQGQVTLASRTHQKWSAVHNEGGTAGQGAEIPKRETIKLDDEDLGVFAEILKEHCLLPFKE